MNVIGKNIEVRSSGPTWALLTIIGVTLGAVHARLPQWGAVQEEREVTKTEICWEQFQKKWGCLNKTFYTYLQTQVLEIKWKNAKIKHE